MKNQKTFTTRRGEAREAAVSSGRYGFLNGRDIRFSSGRRERGSISGVAQGVMVGLLVLIVGLIYVSQGAKASGLDYEISKIDGEISELRAEKEDLAIEKARLTSVATVSQSEVAVNMEEVQPENR